MQSTLQASAASPISANKRGVSPRTEYNQYLNPADMSQLAGSRIGYSPSEHRRCKIYDI